jgi:hypothetical protein
VRNPTLIIDITGGYGPVVGRPLRWSVTFADLTDAERLAADELLDDPPPSSSVPDARTFTLTVGGNDGPTTQVVVNDSNAPVALRSLLEHAFRESVERPR